MIVFIILCTIVLCLAYPVLLRKSSRKEMVIFYLLSLAGMAIWISIFVRHSINPLSYIGWVIDRLVK